jgi:methionyl-tRNA formyltransferase
MAPSNPIPIVFFGTHDFAATILQGLLNSPFLSVRLVITQPDKPVGRRRELKKSPVKILAEKYAVAIEQPASLKSYELRTDATLGVTAQYGLLIPLHILNTPTHGILNVHTSLLPKYRGASPIQSALINGETETGVTIMKMDPGLDTGPILLQKAIAIDPDDTYIDVDKKLAALGRKLLLDAIPPYVDGSLRPIAQDDALATKCSQLSREDGRIDWDKPAQGVYNQYRGMTPWPGIWTTWEGKRLKLLKIKPSKKTLPPGRVSVEHDTIHIGCKEHSIEAFALQLEGKQAMDTAVFLNGYKQLDGATLA